MGRKRERCAHRSGRDHGLLVDAQARFATRHRIYHDVRPRGDVVCLSGLPPSASLYAVRDSFPVCRMVPLEAAISGTSTNPARTFGPALISDGGMGGESIGWDRC